MKLCNWVADMGRQQRLRLPDGMLNIRELWISRMSDDVIELDEKKVRSLQNWEMAALIAKWIAYNDVNPENFLEESEMERNDTQKSITSLNADLISPTQK